MHFLILYFFFLFLIKLYLSTTLFTIFLFHLYKTISLLFFHPSSQMDLGHPLIFHVSLVMENELAPGMDLLLHRACIQNQK